MKIEGNRTESRQIKERGQAKGYESTHSGSGKFAEREVPYGKGMIGFEAGRTIELRRFEFCRIRLWIKAYLQDGMDKEVVQKAEEEFILEMLAREEAAVVDGKHDGVVSDEALDVLSRCVCRSVGVLYGLTLKMSDNDRESEQVDVIEEMPISDVADLLEAFEGLSDEMAAKLSEHYKRIKGSE